MASAAALPVLTLANGQAVRPAHPVLQTRLVGLLLAALSLGVTGLLVILALTGMRLETGLARFVLLALALVALSFFCRFRRYDWRMADSANMVALATVSLLLCGLVSLTGLRVGLPLADPALLRIDRLIGFDVNAVVHYTAARPSLSAFLHTAYNLSGPLCLAAILWNLVRGDRTRLWQVAATLVVAMQVTALISTLLPARGAILFMGLDALHGQGLPFGAGSYSAREFAHFYWGSDPLVRLADMNGIVVFPSFHTVMALVILQGFVASPLRWAAVLWCALTIVSTVPMGGHYVIDLAGGFVVWAAACLLATWACRGRGHPA